MRQVLEHVDSLVLVDDGSRPDVAERLDALAEEFGAELVRQPARSGKGSAVRAGVDRALGADAVLVIDADGQHPPEAIPSFVRAAGDAELVIGDRFDDLAEMPLPRRLANRTTRRLFELATGRDLRDTQNGMRLLRGRALDMLPSGGYEAETLHLRRVLREGVPVEWVPIPAIYGEERSSFRPARDSVKVLWALVRPLGRATPTPGLAPRRARFPQGRPWRSGLPGTRATALRPQPVRAAAA